MGCLVDSLSRGYRVLGFDQATAGDEVFRQLVLARIIEPVSKLDSLRVLEEAGVTPAGPNGGRRDQVIYYQYRHDRARRTLRGIDEQIREAEQAVAGKVPVKRNRFIRLTGGSRTVNRQLEAKARALAGLKGYVTNPRASPVGTPVTAEFVIGSYHQLFQIEALVPDGQKRPAGPPGLPPHPRLDRGPPDDRVRGPGGQPVDRSKNWLVHPQIRQNRPPLPHRSDPGRRPRHHLCRPATRRTPLSIAIFLLFYGATTLGKGFGFAGNWPIGLGRIAAHPDDRRSGVRVRLIARWARQVPDNRPARFLAKVCIHSAIR
jgi:hypothetical protein